MGVERHTRAPLLIRATSPEIANPPGVRWARSTVSQQHYLTTETPLQATRTTFGVSFRLTIRTKPWGGSRFEGSAKDRADKESPSGTPCINFSLLPLSFATRTASTPSHDIYPHKYTAHTTQSGRYLNTSTEPTLAINSNYLRHRARTVFARHTSNRGRGRRTKAFRSVTLYPSLKSRHQARHSHKEREKGPRTSRQLWQQIAAAPLSTCSFSAAPPQATQATQRPSALHFQARPANVIVTYIYVQSFGCPAARQPFPPKSPTKTPPNYVSAHTVRTPALDPLSVLLGSPRHH